VTGSTHPGAAAGRLLGVIGWRRASAGQRFRIALRLLCAMSAVTGVALAAAGIGKRGPSAIGPGPTQSAAATANRARAAAWIAQQVSPAVTVSCDPQMCGQVRRRGFPATRLRALPPSAASPLGSAVVVATPAIRSQFGTRLATAYAPLVIAGFGSGAERVEVRAVAPDGAAAFQAQLVSAHASLLLAGRELLGNRNIQASPAARAVLLAGRADYRLLAVLAVLAADMPIRLVALDDAPPGASSAVALRGAEIGAASSAEASVILTFLDAQHPPYRPAVAAMARGASGRLLVTVRFDALGEPDA
jgi:hypothetical protein